MINLLIDWSKHPKNKKFIASILPSAKDLIKIV